MTPTIHAQAIPFRPECWQLIPRDRKAAGWLKRRRPANAVRCQNGHPYPVLIVTGSQLIELVCLARASGITIQQPGGSP